MQQDWRRLTAYVNKQIILNTYQDGELVAKEGFHFTRIAAEENRLLVFDRDSVVAAVETEGYSSFEQLFGFPNHYAFANDQERLELYFV